MCPRVGGLHAEDADLILFIGLISIDDSHFEKKSLFILKIKRLLV